MHDKERQLYERQIERFILRLKELFYDQAMTLEAEYCNFGQRNLPFKSRMNGKYQSIEVGDTWGQNWEQAWFHITGEVPGTWKGRIVAARLHLGGEGCIFDENGIPVQAISCHSLWMDAFRRDRYVITKNARGGEMIDLWVDVSAAQLFGLHLQNDPHPQDLKRYGHHAATVVDLSLVTFREDIWQLYLDGTVLDNLMRALPETSVRRARILYALREAADQFDNSKSSIAESRRILKKELQKPATASALSAAAVGHAHIDTAWLWPLRETIKKCARTFCTQIALIEKYPGYIFGASQPQHYQFIKDHYPSLYKKIKQYVNAGQWEIQGGMWVEADCNLISGESMVRQFLHGMNFFKDEFGITVKNLWLPDVFGYSAAMPQILKKCGVNVMVTQKISWNQLNTFPHHSFIWQGIDRSEIVVHFPPEDTYNSELKPQGMRKAQSNFAEKSFLDEFLVLYGIGDGGGGPTEEIIESGIRQQNLEGCPKIIFGHAQEMLDRLAAQKERLPRWVGELYLELHRGTLTTQAYNKKMNRTMELKLRELEFLYGAFHYEHYPLAELDGMWKKLLLNQFHDIIPGSSIHIVYQDSRKDYRELSHTAEELYGALADHLSGQQKDIICLVNTLSYRYQRPVMLPKSWRGCEIYDEKGQSIPTQVINQQTMMIAEIPGLSAKIFKRGKTLDAVVESPPKNRKSSLSGGVLENELIYYEFAADGTIRHAFDKECQREALAEGCFGNLLRLYEDRPNDWDAWDVDIFYENQLRGQAQLQSWEIWQQGSLMQELHLKFIIGQSTITQKITLAANSKRLEFATKVNWQERHKMLRVGFFVNVFADHASYEIQYGMVKRPTHRNTSWDIAKFEVAGHRFADLSDHQYGVALLNDCKYGHKVLDNFMELNLLRAPTMPDPEADQGVHEFTYALLPHKNNILYSNVFSEASQLNQPLSVFEGLDNSQLYFPFRLDSENVVLEVLKKAEKEDALIFRLYEPRGLSVKVSLELTNLAQSIYETSLLEENLRELQIDAGSITLHFKPFEIKTLKVKAL